MNNATTFAAGDWIKNKAGTVYVVWMNPTLRDDGVVRMGVSKWGGGRSAHVTVRGWKKASDPRDTRSVAYYKEIGL